HVDNRLAPLAAREHRRRTRAELAAAGGVKDQRMRVGDGGLGISHGASASSRCDRWLVFPWRWIGAVAGHRTAHAGHRWPRRATDRAERSPPCRRLSGTRRRYRLTALR